LVKWVNRRNVRRQYEKHHLRKTTKEVLFGKRRETADKDNVPTTTRATSPDTFEAPSQSLLDDRKENTTKSGGVGDGIGDDRKATWNYFRRGSSQSAVADERQGRTDSNYEWECIPHDGQIELRAMQSDMDDLGSNDCESYAGQ
jgi:hypothetical protein